MALKIEMNGDERAALLTIVGTLERKAAKGEFWKGRMAPIAALIERIRNAKEEPESVIKTVYGGEP